MAQFAKLPWSLYWHCSDPLNWDCHTQDRLVLTDTYNSEDFKIFTLWFLNIFKTQNSHSDQLRNSFEGKLAQIG